MSFVFNFESASKIRSCNIVLVIVEYKTKINTQTQTVLDFLKWISNSELGSFNSMACHICSYLPTMYLFSWLDCTYSSILHLKGQDVPKSSNVIEYKKKLQLLCYLILDYDFGYCQSIDTTT